MATSGVGGRCGVPVRLGPAASGVKASAGSIKPLLAFGLCLRVGLHGGLLRLAYLAAAGLKAPGSFPPRPRPFCRFRRCWLGVGLYFTGPPRFPVLNR